MPNDQQPNIVVLGCKSLKCQTTVDGILGARDVSCVFLSLALLSSSFPFLGPLSSLGGHGRDVNQLNVSIYAHAKSHLCVTR